MDPAEYLRDMMSVFRDAEVQELDGKNADRFMNGAPVRTDIETDKLIKVRCEDRILGIARNECGYLKKLIHLAQGE